MYFHLISLTSLLLVQGCEGSEKTPNEPTSIDHGDPILSESLQMPGDELAATIVTPRRATLPEVLAAKEVRRYVYQRTGELLALTSSDTLPEGDVILVAVQTSALVSDLDHAIRYDNPPGGFLIKSVEQEERTVLVITGIDPDATLHGTYRFAEHLGVGFGLEGDIIPDARVALNISGYDEVAVPLLETRGLLPFHDFPEGPDFWNTDDYLMVVSQMPKLGLNFIGFHNYPRWSSTEEAGL